MGQGSQQIECGSRGGVSDQVAFDNTFALFIDERIKREKV
jgi:hypothetical protein